MRRALLLTLLLAASPGKADGPFCSAYIKTHQDGSWETVYLRCLDDEAKRALDQNRKNAQKYMGKYRRQLQKDLKQQLGISPTDADFDRARDALGRANGVPGGSWPQFLRDNPNCSGSDGCTVGGKNIYAVGPGSRDVLVHEAIHALLGHRSVKKHRSLDHLRERIDPVLDA